MLYGNLHNFPPRKLTDGLALQAQLQQVLSNLFLTDGLALQAQLQQVLSNLFYRKVRRRARPEHCSGQRDAGLDSGERIWGCKCFGENVKDRAQRSAPLPVPPCEE